ncbi:MAG: hypothetical protein ABSC32_06815 [Steroidobacteraceae bacterium]
MNRLKSLALACAFAGVCLTATAFKSEAQDIVDIGDEPECPYGYYDYAPYSCAPYGYYGPEWFAGGVFIGAGPWFHGPANFVGHVDGRFDVRRGFRGPLPNRGDLPSRGLDHIDRFHGSEMRDGHGGGGGGRR